VIICVFVFTNKQTPPFTHDHYLVTSPTHHSAINEQRVALKQHEVYCRRIQLRYTSSLFLLALCFLLSLTSQCSSSTPRCSLYPANFGLQGFFSFLSNWRNSSTNLSRGTSTTPRNDYVDTRTISLSPYIPRDALQTSVCRALFVSQQLVQRLD
jgi:hypothetical protein